MHFVTSLAIVVVGFLQTMEMFSMIKHSLATDGNNPISKYFQLGRQTGSAGPEMVWKVFDAKRLTDGRVCILLLINQCNECFLQNFYIDEMFFTIIANL